MNSEERCTYCPRRPELERLIAEVAGKADIISPDCVTQGPVPATLVQRPIEISPGVAYVNLGSMVRINICPDDMSAELRETYVDTMGLGPLSAQESGPKGQAPQGHPPETV
jgi:hypothetical protein